MTTEPLLSKEQPHQKGQDRSTMLPLLHKHMETALEQQSKTDSTMIVTAIAFDLIMLAVNSSVAVSSRFYSKYGDEKESSFPGDFFFYVFVIVTLMINAVCFAALQPSRDSREMLLDGLFRMYKDENVSEYFDARLLKNYRRRYAYFETAILCLLLMSILVPVAIRF